MARTIGAMSNFVKFENKYGVKSEIECVCGHKAVDHWRGESHIFDCSKCKLCKKFQAKQILRKA